MKIKHWIIILIATIAIDLPLRAILLPISNVAALISVAILSLARSVALIAIVILLCKRGIKKKKQLHDDIHTIAEHYRKEP